MSFMHTSVASSYFFTPLSLSDRRNSRSEVEQGSLVMIVGYQEQSFNQIDLLLVGMSY